MPIPKIIIPLISISCLLLAGCSHVSGNVISEGGPTMENIYDQAGDDFTLNNLSDVKDSVAVPPHKQVKASYADHLSENADFSKLPNPELKLYVFPHLAGSEMLPVPGYWTAFSAYSRDYYALPLSLNSDVKKSS
jgi:conjugative transfer region lipoprotein (TIGR03751 family)